MLYNYCDLKKNIKAAVINSGVVNAFDALKRKDAAEMEADYQRLHIIKLNGKSNLQTKVRYTVSKELALQLPY